MKVLRKGEIIEVEEIEPGDISIIEDDRMPIGHVHIIQGPIPEWKGLYPDGITDEELEDMNDEDWD